MWSVFQTSSYSRVSYSDVITFNQKGAKTDWVERNCNGWAIPAYVKILNNSNNAFFIDRLKIINVLGGNVFTTGENNGGGWCISGDTSDSFSNIDGEEVE